MTPASWRRQWPGGCYKGWKRMEAESTKGKCMSYVLARRYRNYELAEACKRLASTQTHAHHQTEGKELKKKQEASKNSWSIDINNVSKNTFDLSVSNPNIVESVDERTPEKIISEIKEIDAQNESILKKIKNLL